MLINCIKQDGSRKTTKALADLLRECTRSKNLCRGKLLHIHILELGLGHDRFLCNILLEMYGKCNSLEEANALFQKMPERNLYSWNIMIAAYAQNGHYKSALSLLQEMDLEGMKPSEVTYVSLITSCCEFDSPQRARSLHARVEACGLANHLVVGTALINLCGKFGWTEKARQVFYDLPTKNVVSWTSMIRALARNGLNKEALELYKTMESASVEPNEYTLACAAEACGNGGTLSDAREIHGCITKNGYETLGVVGTAVVDMYCKLGSLDDAAKFFEMEQRKKSVFSRNLLIAAYARGGHVSESLKLYRSMEQDGVEPDCVTFLETLAVCGSSGDLVLGESIHGRVLEHGYDSDETVSNALVTMYGKCESLEAARDVFGGIRKKNVVSWTTMISALARNGHSKDAMKLYWRMDLEGVTPNEQTFISVLNACMNLAMGRSIHERFLRSGFKLDGVLGNALLDMYGRCKSPDEARIVFDALETKTIVAWTSMIAAYSGNGRKTEAFQLYECLPEEPTSVTFVIVLEACSSFLDVERGRDVHSSVVASDLDKDVFVGTSLVDMYGKCGELETARGVFDGITCKNTVSWNAMIAVYVQHGIGFEAIQLFREMDVEPDSITYICTLDACGVASDVETGRDLHRKLESSGFLEDSSVGNALVRMYTNCGELGEARVSFEHIEEKSSESWNTMVSALGRLGNLEESVELFSNMELEGFNADEASVTGILSAYSHAGLKGRGGEAFVYMFHDFGVSQTLGHYVCIVDLLGRVGQLEEAEELVVNMPFEAGFMAWTTLLGACSTHGDVERGLVAAENAFVLNENKTSAYVLLSNMCRSCNIPETNSS